jgi:hypothetical protein
VLAFCRPELLADNYFHAVLEATKSVASAIRLRPATALSWRSRPSVGATRRYGSTRSAQTPSGASNVGSRTCLWASSARSGTRPHTPPRRVANGGTGRTRPSFPGLIAPPPDQVRNATLACRLTSPLLRPNNRLQGMRGLACFRAEGLARWPRTPDPCVVRPNRISLCPCS